jgi:hypothetical protein
MITVAMNPESVSGCTWHHPQNGDQRYRVTAVGPEVLDAVGQNDPMGGER